MATDYYPQPTEEQLDDLGSGCWARIDNGKNSFWVEVSGVENDTVNAEIREILTSDDSTSFSLGQEIRFKKHQINALGCDHFCFC